MVDVAQVYIWGKEVGAVRWDQTRQLALFQYNPEFVNSGWELSPLKMPLRSSDQIFSFPALRMKPEEEFSAFKGLPGLLADALPDRYGNQLMDIYLARNGRQPGSMNPVEQLCFMGKRGMGALEFIPSYTPDSFSNKSLEVDQLAQVAQKMLADRNTMTTNLRDEEEQAMQEILKIGTSAGGARPKAVIAYDPETGEVRSGQSELAHGFEHWLIKLDGVSEDQWTESKGWGRVEYAYYLMALDCGIIMNPCKLLESQGRAHFMTQRFDRTNDGRKHHIQTWCGLEHYDYNQMYAFSYEQLFMTMRNLRLSYPDAEQMFRRMVFNVLATNRDDHTKNFAFMMEENGEWKLSPAYDLCFSYHPDNFWVQQQTLSVRGKRTEITIQDLLDIGAENGVKDALEIVQQIRNIVEDWRTYATQAGIQTALQNKIASQLCLIG